MGVLVASTVAALGTPSEDGVHGLIRTTHVEEPLTWNLENEVWIGNPRVTMRINENVGISTQGLPTGWKYPGTFTENPPPVVKPVSGRFFIHKVLYAGELYAAGLRLQEHLSGEMRQAYGDAGTLDSEYALSWYILAEDDDFLSPDSFNHGVRLVLDKDFNQSNYHWCSSGWQNQPTLDADPGAEDHFYPEIYQYGAGANLRKFTALNRWVGGVALGATGSFEKPSVYPPWFDLRGWYRASSIPLANGQSVAEWQDDSGYGRVLRQPTSAKRPTVMVSDLGPSNSGRFVRFDGTNDMLGTVLSPLPLTGPEWPEMSGPSVTPSWSLFAVMRQRASAPAQQVWFCSESGPTLIFRNDGTNSVGVWAGGSDVFYSRSGSWPSPWMIWSVNIDDGGNLSIWENGSEVGTGAHGNAGLNGFRVGNNGSETIPAAIDVAELMICQGEMTTLQRTALVNFLNDKYEIF